jgi:hypothetical protein
MLVPAKLKHMDFLLQHLWFPILMLFVFACVLVTIKPAPEKKTNGSLPSSSETQVVEQYRLKKGMLSHKYTAYYSCPNSDCKELLKSPCKEIGVEDSCPYCDAKFQLSRDKLDWQLQENEHLRQGKIEAARQNREAKGQKRRRENLTEDVPTENWYYQDMGVEIGPVSNGQMREFIMMGSVTNDTLVRKGRAGVWATTESYGQMLHSEK